MPGIKKTVLLLLLSVLAVAGLSACGKSGDTPGERLDRALDDTGDAVKDAGEAIKSR